MKFPDVEVIHVSAESNRLPFPDGRFDALICHDVVATLLANPATASSPFARLSASLFGEVFRVLKSGGFAHFGAKNPHGYTRLLKRLRCPLGTLSGASRLAPLRRLKSRTKRAGFQDFRLYSFMVENDRVSEVIPPSGYRSNKNSLGASERLKQIILGKTGARYLAPAYGLVCAKDCGLAPPLQDFVQGLVAQKILPRVSDNGPGFQRYLSLPGKAIVTFGEAANSPGNVIVVIPKVTSTTPTIMIAFS